MEQGNLAINEIELKKIAYLGEEKVITSLNIGRLPFHDVNIYFSEDIWDFKKQSFGAAKYRYNYDFSIIHPEYKVFIKQFVLESLINRQRASTIHKYFGYLKKIVRYLESNHIYDWEFITEDIVNKFNDFLKLNLKSENERIHHRRLFTRIISYIEHEKGVDYSGLKKILSKNNSALLKAQIEEGKTPSIPNHIFDKIISCALKEISNGHIPIHHKKEACATLLLSQIGMRISELILLEAKNRKEVACFNGENIPYLEFITYKTTQRKDGTVTKTFLTDKANLAYSTLEELTKDDRARKGTSYFFTSSDKNTISPITMTNLITRFIVRNAKEIGLINTSHDGFKIITKDLNSKNKRLKPEYLDDLNQNDFISCPKPHQFRVAVCNKLIKEGVQTGWVSEHMNHLSIDMTTHYIRQDDKKEKKIAQEVFKGILKDEFRLIGEEVEQLMVKVNEFISKNEYTVKDNLEEIIEALSGEIPIREKREGYCIKSAFGKKCKHNEFICAFEMCPNHCTSYLFADITYRRFQEHKKVIEYNEANNFIREAQIEKNKLIRMVNSYLINELKELKNEVNEQSKEEIIKKHHHLLEMVSNMETIIEEVEQWIEKN